MTRARFNNLIQNPSSISYGEMDELKNVIEQFPYFQSARLLYTKSLFDNKSYLFNDELKKTAAFAGDRKVLHKIIHNTSTKAKNEYIIEEKIVEPQITTFENAIPLSAVVEEESESAKHIFEDSTDEIKSSEVFFEIDEEETGNLKSEIGNENYQAPETLNAEPSFEPTRVLSAAEILSQRLREIEKDLDGEKTELTKSSVVPPAENVVQEYFSVSDEINIDEFITTKVNEPVSTPDQPHTETSSRETKIVSPVSGNETHSFNEWMQRFSLIKTTEQGSTFEKVQDRMEKKTPDVTQTAVQPTILSRLEQTILAQTPAETHPGHLAKNDLIDLFIKNEPRIDGSKTKFYSPVNAAKSSVADVSEIVSETLAKIYIQQGNFNKAIQSYEKLSLKYPEKSVYFAALIKEIRNVQ